MALKKEMAPNHLGGHCGPHVFSFIRDAVYCKHSESMGLLHTPKMRDKLAFTLEEVGCEGDSSVINVVSVRYK